MKRVGHTILRWSAPVATLAIGGTLAFGLLHAVLIAPIWPRLVGGLPFALPFAAALTWCWAELQSRRILRRSPVHGIFFGGVLWLALLPTTLVAAGLRAWDLRERLGGFEPVVELAVAAAAGLAVGWALMRSRRGAASAAACVAAAVVVMAGPIAVTEGATQRALFLGFLPLFALAGMALSRFPAPIRRSEPLMGTP